MDIVSARVGNATHLALRVLLSHHPVCSYFDDDVLRPFRLRICSGCLVTWPAVTLSFLAATVWSPIAAEQALIVGLLLGIPYVVGVFLALPRAWRHVSKVVGGLGLGSAAWGLVAAPLPPASKILVFALGTLGFVLLLAVRMRAILQTCRRCPYAMDWEVCPGMLGHRSAPIRLGRRTPAEQT